MKLEIHFYGKDRLAVFTQADSSESTPDQELFLFGWFALRQFHNLGHHLTADVFSGLLHFPDMNELVKETPQLPSVVELLESAHYAKYPLGSEVRERANSADIQKELLNLAMRRNFPDNASELIQRDFLSQVPQIIEYQRTPSNKRFVATLPPGVLDMQGFGILGWQVNYFVCHSILGLLRYLGMRNSTDEIYLKRLSSVATSCSEAHMQNKITMLNQIDLATLFVVESK
jgi:hypothetical protein